MCGGRDSRRLRAGLATAPRSALHRPDPHFDRPDLAKTLAVRRKVDFKLDGHGPAHSLLLDPAGTRVVTRSAGGITGLWSTRTGTLLADLSRGAPVNLLAFSGDGRRLATAHDGLAVRIWDAITGRELGELAHDAPVEALVFARDCPRVITIETSVSSASSGAARKHILTAWHLNLGAIANVATCEIGGDSPPIIHTSGRWLAYADERLVHVWDTARAADISAIYADFDDPAVVLNQWRLDPADALPPTPFGIQTAATLPLTLTDTRFLQVTSVLNSAASKRTVALWNAEHAYEAADVVAARRLVTTRTEVVGPTYADVNVHVVVVRRLPTIDPVRLKKEIEAALVRFFDSLHGGPDRAGWPLGRPVYMSEICQVVEAVDGVDHVERVSWGAGQAEKLEQLDIPRHSLVKCKPTVHVR